MRAVLSLQPRPAVKHSGLGAQRHPGEQGVLPRSKKPGGREVLQPRVSKLGSKGPYFALVHRSPTFMLRPCRSTYLFLSNLQSLNGTSDFCWLHICLVECPFISLPHLSCLQSVKNSEFLSSSNKTAHFAGSYSVGAEKIRRVLP